MSNLFNYIPPTKEEAAKNRQRRMQTRKNSAIEREHRELIEGMPDTNPRFPIRPELPERVYINDTKHQREDEQRDTQLPGKKRRTVEEVSVFGQPGKIQPFIVGERPDPSSSGFSYYGPGLQSSSGSAGVVSTAAARAERRANPKSYEIAVSEADPDSIPTRNRDCRNVILFPGQLLPPDRHIDENDLPTPAWVASLTQSIQSLKSFLVNDIVPFELIDRIRYYIDPTQEQYEAIREGRRTAWEVEGRRVTDIPSLRARIQEVTHGDPRRPEVLEFSRVVSNFFTSVEAPAELISISRGCDFENIERVKCSNSQGDNPDIDGERNYQKSSAAPQFADLRPAQLAEPLQQIIDMARGADNVLRRLGIHARFGVWSPYGPGAGGLKRFFLIYDGVIEPRVVARELSQSGEGTVVDALSILTAAAGGGLVTADAVAEVQLGRNVATMAGAQFVGLDEQNFQQITNWRESYPGEVPFEPSIGQNGELLRIPIHDAYKAWYAALWTQSHLRHEERVSDAEIMTHCRMIEFRLGYHMGTQYRHMPTFYELRLERPIQGACRGVKDFFGSAGASMSAAATSCCNFLGVDNDGVLIPSKVKLSAEEASQRIQRLVSRARRHRRMHDLVRGVGSIAESIQQAAVRGAQFAGPAISASARQGATMSMDFADSGSRRGRELGQSSVATSRDAAASSADFGRQLMTKAVTAAAAASVDLSLIGPMLAMEFPNQQIETLADAAAGNVLVVGGGIAAGGGARLTIQSNPTIIENEGGGGGGGGGGGEVNIPSVQMSIFPVVVSPRGQFATVDSVITMIEGNPLLANPDVAAVLSPANPEVAGILTEMLIQIAADPTIARGIRGKKGPKRLTRRERKERKERKGRKGCKGTKKGCKGKQGRGTKKRGKKKGTSHKSMPPTNTMRILKQKLNYK